MVSVAGTPWMRIMVIPEVASPIRPQTSLYYRHNISRCRCNRFFFNSRSRRWKSSRTFCSFANRKSPRWWSQNFALQFARSNGGKFVLRIEDTDLRDRLGNLRKLCLEIFLGLVLIGMKVTASVFVTMIEF